MLIILRDSPVSVIPPILKVNFHLSRSTILIRRTSGRSLGPPKNNSVVNISGHEKEFRVSCMNTGKKKRDGIITLMCTDKTFE